MKRKMTWVLVLAAGALLLAAGLLVGIDPEAVAAEPAGAAALVSGPMSDAGLGSTPEMDPMAAGGPYPTSCTATNDCACCPISCTGSHSCIAYDNYVSCDGATKYCGQPCC